MFYYITWLCISGLFDIRHVNKNINSRTHILLYILKSFKALVLLFEYYYIDQIIRHTGRFSGQLHQNMP
jgi:hypothetical protein